MNVTFTPQANQISPMRSYRFAAAEEKSAKATGESTDQMEISQAGRQAIAEVEGEPGLDQDWEKLESNLNNLTKGDFMSMVREQLGEQKLEVNWNATVDPDGQIWCKAYFDSYICQVTTFKSNAESAINDYYAGAYQEALNNPLGNDLSSQLNFIAAKYQCSWSNYFDESMPAAERQWTYTQVRAMLTGTGLRLNDPYALKGIHIPKEDEITNTAKQAADDRISELVQQTKQQMGITD